MTLKQGQNPWTLSSTKLKLANTPENFAKIAEYDARMAELNRNYSLNQNDHRDENLKPGATLKTPRV